MVCVNGTLDPRPTGRTKLELEGHFALKKTVGPGLCLVAGCKKRHVDRRRCGGLLLCARHYQQRWRTQNPKMSAYRNLKDHARGRKIEFTLSFTRFVQITDAANYWNQDAESVGGRLTVDRIEMHLGYTDTNVQVLTHSENAAKGNKERWLPENIRAILARKRAQQEAPAWAMTGAREDGWLESEGDPF